MATAAKKDKKQERIDALNSVVKTVQSIFDERLPARKYGVFYNKGGNKSFNQKEFKSAISIKFVTDSSRYDLMQQIFNSISKYRPKHITNSNLSGLGHLQFTIPLKGIGSVVTFYVIVKYRNANAFRSLPYSNILMDEKGFTTTFKNRSPDTSEEHRILHYLNKKIYELGNESPVDIILKPNNKYNSIIGFIPGPSGTHADFVGIDENLNELCFISHKQGSSANNFQQYSGISAAAGLNIHNDTEVEQFRKVISTKESDEFANQSFSRKIESKELKSKAIFGSDYDSGDVGHNSCTHFMQGNVNVSKKRTKRNPDDKAQLVVSFNSKNVYRSNVNQLDRAGYRPVLGARRGESTRTVRYGSNVVSGVRGGIFPEAYIEGRNNSEI